MVSILSWGFRPPSPAPRPFSYITNENSLPMISIFPTQEPKPTSALLKKALGKTYKLWEELEEFTLSISPKAESGWNFSGIKFGWSYRIKDKKRVLIYLLPRDNYFKVAMVFGEKATQEILKSKVHETIKTELRQAKVYAEGRGIRIEVRNDEFIQDLKELIKIKIVK